jgi:hypothetical protein
VALSMKITTPLYIYDKITVYRRCMVTTMPRIGRATPMLDTRSIFAQQCIVVSIETNMLKLKIGLGHRRLHLDWVLERELQSTCHVRDASKATRQRCVRLQ